MMWAKFSQNRSFKTLGASGLIGMVNNHWNHPTWEIPVPYIDLWWYTGYLSVSSCILSNHQVVSWQPQRSSSNARKSSMKSPMFGFQNYQSHLWQRNALHREYHKPTNQRPLNFTNVPRKNFLLQDSSQRASKDPKELTVNWINFATDCASRIMSKLIVHFVRGLVPLLFLFWLEGDEIQFPWENTIGCLLYICGRLMTW